jgi:hypothetical protein
MRASQRREIDRLVELDTMKSDFLSVAAQQFLAPALEIQEAGDTLARRAAPALGPEGIKRLRVIQGGARTLAKMANDLGDASVVFSPAAAAPTSHEPEPSAEPPTLTVVTSEAAFHPTAPSPTATPPTATPPTATLPTATPPPNPIAAPAPAAIEVPAPIAGDPAAPAAATELVDIARLVEGIAVDLLVAGAERGIEVAIAVEPELIHPTVDVAALEGAIREHGERAIAGLPSGASVTFAARRTASSIEIRVDGGATPFELALPLAPPDASAVA